MLRQCAGITINVPRVALLWMMTVEIRNVSCSELNSRSCRPWTSTKNGRALAKLAQATISVSFSIFSDRSSHHRGGDQWVNPHQTNRCLLPIREVPAYRFPAQANLALLRACLVSSLAIALHQAHAGSCVVQRLLSLRHQRSPLLQSFTMLQWTNQGKD